MSDFITMQDLIAKRVRFSASAAASGIQADIKDAIAEAISFYKHNMFWFNQQDAKADTVDGQEYYPLPSAYIAMLNVVASYSSGSQRTRSIVPRTEEEMDELNSSESRGQPHYRCIHNEQIRLSPIPDGVYELNMSFVRDVMVDNPLVDDTDTNEWTTDAGPMIRYRAQAILWDDLIRNPQEADRCLVRAESFRAQLVERTRTYLQSSWISPQAF